MSDFEQWYESEFDSGLHYDATVKAWQAAIASMQGEEVAWAYERATEVSEGLPLGTRYGGFERSLSYNKPKDHQQFRNARPLFTYPPSAASKIAKQDARIKELEQQLAKLEVNHSLLRKHVRMAIDIKSMSDECYDFLTASIRQTGGAE